MAAYEYDDFRIRFTPISGTHAYVLVADAPDGIKATATFDLPLTDEDLRRAVMTLGRTRSITRDIGAPPPEQKVTAEQFGARLASALLTGEVGRSYEAARKRAVEAGRGLRLRLSLKDAPALLDVPWEFMYLKPTFLASQRRTPIVRFLETDSPVAPSRVGDRVCILGLVANPRGSQQLDVGSERTKVDMALEKVRKERDVNVDWLDPATPRRLRQSLQDGAYHILHFVGHSDYVRGEGVLLLEDEQGGPSMVSAAQFVNLLGDQDTLRLVVLNSCEGSRTDAADPFAGLATSIVGLGVPAVVAMQFEISDKAAITFAEELYHSLIARQDPIDAAVAEARKAVFTEVNEIEWATPVLFLRNDDGKLFTFDQPLKLPPPVPLLPITEPNLITDRNPITEPTPVVDPEPLTVANAALPDVHDVPTTPIATEPIATGPVPPLQPPTFAAPPNGGGKKKRGRGLLVGGIIAVLLLVAGGVGVALVAGGDDTGSTDPTQPTTGSSAQTTTAGSTATPTVATNLNPDDFGDPLDVTLPLQNPSTQSQSNDVVKVQSYLLRSGIPVGSLGVDGEFGPLTEEAVLTFQQSRGLPADGIVGQATASQMSDWIGPRSRGDDLAIAAVDKNTRDTHLFVVDPATGVIGLATTKGGVADVHPAWNPNTNRLAFSRSGAANEIDIVVPSVGNDPRGGGDAGLTVRQAARTLGTFPTWTGDTTLALVVDGQGCAASPCKDIVQVAYSADKDLVVAAGNTVALSQGWSDVTAMDADRQGRLIVSGIGPDGTGRRGVWLVIDSSVTFLGGSEQFVEATFSTDGQNMGTIGNDTSTGAVRTVLASIVFSGSLSATTTDDIIQQGRNARPDVAFPTSVQFESVTSAPPETGAVFAVLLRPTDGSGLRPLIVLLDQGMRFVDVVVPVLSPIDSNTTPLDPADWADIVGLAG